MKKFELPKSIVEKLDEAVMFLTVTGRKHATIPVTDEEKQCLEKIDADYREEISHERREEVKA